MFKLTINTTDNAAFFSVDDGAPEPLPEVARILRDLARKVETGAQIGGGKVLDVNGNHVGDWEMTPFAMLRR